MDLEIKKESNSFQNLSFPKMPISIIKSNYKSLILILAITSLPILSNLKPKSLNASSTQLQINKESFVSIAVAKSGPAVVTLETQRTVRSQGPGGLPPRLLMDPYLQRFFGLPEMDIPRSRIERSQGSGVIFSSNGLVLTNAHVVENIESLIVGLSDGRRVTAKVIGQDRLTDLAVIRLDGYGPWPTAKLGNSDALNVGDWAIAVGNPFGLENTVTLGIISNLNRNVAQLGISDKRLNLIQTDAAINPGNSGGPLLNAEGEVIGINTLVRSGPGAGLGFAIPINRAKSIAKELVEMGRASHPIIGVSLSSFPQNNIQGVIIRYVIPKGPAAKGGLKIGDIIYSIDNRKMNKPSDVIEIINESGVNKTLKFLLKRGGQEFYVLIRPVDINKIETP